MTRSSKIDVVRMSERNIFLFINKLKYVTCVYSGNISDAGYPYHPAIIYYYTDQHNFDNNWFRMFKFVIQGSQNLPQRGKNPPFWKFFPILYFPTFLPHLLFCNIYSRNHIKKSHLFHSIKKIMKNFPLFPPFEKIFPHFM